jgi:hypothetical protein
VETTHTILTAVILQYDCFIDGMSIVMFKGFLDERMAESASASQFRLIENRRSSVTPVF